MPLVDLQLVWGQEWGGEWPKSKPIPFGTGVLATSRRQTFILTADHLLKDIGQVGYSVLFPPDVGKDVVRSAEELRRILRTIDKRDMSEGVNLVPKDVIHEKVAGSDIAALEIESHVIPRWCETIDCDFKVNANPKYGERLFLLGLPNEGTVLQPGPESELSVKSGCSVVPLNVAGVRSPRKWLDEHGNRAYDRACHFALKPAIIDHGLKGMSGGGVWKLRKVTRRGVDLWFPDLKLCGIQSAYHAGFNRVKVVKVNTVRSLLM